jgi:hypothetical protein
MLQKFLKIELWGEFCKKCRQRKVKKGPSVRRTWYTFHVKKVLQDNDEHKVKKGPSSVRRTWYTFHVKVLEDNDDGGNSR